MRARRFVSHALNAALATMAAAALALGALTFIPALFGCGTYIVKSSSMAPGIPLGSLAIVDRSMHGEHLRIGDVAAFRIGDADGSVCVHRTQDIYQEGGLIQTKGDANDAPDLRLIPFEDIVGVVCAHVPYAGWSIAWLEENRLPCAGVAIALALAAAALSFSSPQNINMAQKEKGTICPNRPEPHLEEA